LWWLTQLPNLLDAGAEQGILLLERLRRCCRRGEGLKIMWVRIAAAAVELFFPAGSSRIAAACEGLAAESRRELVLWAVRHNGCSGGEQLVSGRQECRSYIFMGEQSA
jgi:hypothetical protein